MSDNAALPPEVDLDSIFHGKSLFDSVGRLDEAGFQIVRGSKDRVTVFGHPSLPGYLFKKFLRTVEHSYEKQLAKYERRVGGARALRAHLEALDIHSIVAPRKWLCELPTRFRSGGRPEYVVLVEKYDLLERDDTKKRYRRVSRDTVRDLCTIFFTFKGVDFAARNTPFTTEGQIAFIDTGFLSRITDDLSFRRKSYKKYVHKKLLTSKSQRYAMSLWDEFKERGDLLRGLRGKVLR